MPFKRKAGMSTSSIFATLVALSSILMATAVAVMIPPLWHVRQIVITAAQNGARVAALTQNQQEVQNAVLATLQDANLPVTENGVPLYSVTTPATSIVDGTSDPMSKVTVTYQAPLLFPNVFSTGNWGGTSLGMRIPMSETADSLNESYFSGGVN